MTMNIETIYTCTADFAEMLARDAAEHNCTVTITEIDGDDTTIRIAGDARRMTYWLKTLVCDDDQAYYEEIIDGWREIN